MFLGNLEMAAKMLKINFVLRLVLGQFLIEDGGEADRKCGAEMDDMQQRLDSMNPLCSRQYDFSKQEKHRWKHQ